MFVRKKKNKSGLISIQVIDKSNGKYRVVKTIGSSAKPSVVEQLYLQGKTYITECLKLQELDFNNYRNQFDLVLNSITSHKLVGIELVLGKIFDNIGFNQIQDSLFRDLVLYRLVYPKSKLKTIEYLNRYEQKTYSEDDIYRYMDKLHSSQKQQVQQISFNHTKKILGGNVKVVFYDVTTIYFQTDKEDELRKTGFSKEGKHQNPQIVLGLLVSRGGYPLAYDIFEGNKFEGHTMIPVLEAFKLKYKLTQMTVIADAGLLSNDNIRQLEDKGYKYILGARIKNESKTIKAQVLELELNNGQSKVIEKADAKLIITYSADRAKKDAHNRERGIKRLNKLIVSGKLTKSSINKRGYNKFLELKNEVKVAINQPKIDADKKWDGLKGYTTNSKLHKDVIIENYQQLWQIERAFRVAKSELKIRPIYHYKRRRIEAHICLNFVAYKVYKELERQLKEMKSDLSAQKTIEIAQNIYQIKAVTPNNETISKTIILTEEQRKIQKLFNF